MNFVEPRLVPASARSSIWSFLSARKGIATCQCSRFEASGEPLGALLRGTVSKGVGYNIALRLPLQPVIADGGCRLQRRLNVARLYKPPSLLRVVRPYSS